MSAGHGNVEGLSEKIGFRLDLRKKQCVFRELAVNGTWNKYIFTMQMCLSVLFKLST